MATVLPGYTFDRRTARYHRESNRQFVDRKHILRLLDTQISTAEQRLGDIVTAMHEGNISHGFGQTLMRDELRRLHLQNSALAKGGFDRLDFRDYGRVGRQLRDTYARVSNLAQDIKAGRVSIDQALNRVSGYVGDARRNFYITEREALQATGGAYEERRRLNARESCKDCMRYAGMSWQPLGVLPLPGEQSRCNAHCRCNIERREVTVQMQQERMTQQLERMMAA